MAVGKQRTRIRLVDVNQRSLIRKLTVLRHVLSDLLILPRRPEGMGWHRERARIVLEIPEPRELPECWPQVQVAAGEDPVLNLDGAEARIDLRVPDQHIASVEAARGDRAKLDGLAKGLLRPALQR